MNKLATVQKGFILLFTLMIIAVMMLMITFMSNQVNVVVPQAHVLLEQEKAEQLALSGVEIARAQLMQPLLKKEKKEQEVQPLAPQKPQQAAPSPEKEILENLLAVCNTWQQFKFNTAADGVTGTIDFYITCEQSKLDLNQIYDFEKKKFIGEGSPQGDMKKTFKELCGLIKVKTNENDLFSLFEKFFKERQYKLNDISELLTIKGFEVFKDYVLPMPPSKQSKEKKNQLPVLFDFFTLYSGRTTLEPWLLSKSWCNLLGFKVNEELNKEKRKKMATELSKQFKPNANWSSDWNKLLTPLYEKDFNSVPNFISPLFATKFEAKTFCVVSYGTVGRTTVGCCAIIEVIGAQADEREIVLKKRYMI
jgi:hypothetical protein